MKFSVRILLSLFLIMGVSCKKPESKSKAPDASASASQAVSGSMQASHEGLNLTDYTLDEADENGGRKKAEIYNLHILEPKTQEQDAKEIF